jgi:hypothetical protein
VVFQYLEHHLLAVAAKSPCKSGAQYVPHRPEQTALYQLIQQHTATFFAQARDATGSSLPRYVKDEFDSFLSCGILRNSRLFGGPCYSSSASAPVGVVATYCTEGVVGSTAQFSNRCTASRS